MLKRVDVGEIEIGMFIHRLEGSWFKHPFWRARFLLTDPARLRTLVESEVESVIIDTARGLDVRAETPAGELPARVAHVTRREVAVRPKSVAARTFVSRPAPSATTSVEFGKARKVLGKANRIVSRVFLEARLGKAIGAKAIEPVIEDIYASVQRNLYAFTGLLQCRQDSEFVYRHALAVSALMIALGRQMKLSSDETREAGMAGLLMDIGVGQLPVDVVEPCAGAVTDLADQHTILGYALLKAAGDIPDAVLRVCLRHHERLDGSGYPQGVVGSDLDLFSRMAAICDIYDTLVSGGNGIAPLDPAAAVRLLGDLGRTIDQDIVRHFIETVGVWPIGALVRLRSDRLAMVIDEDPFDSALPTVRVFYSLTLGQRIKGETIALAHCYGEDEIVGAADLSGLDLPSTADLRRSLLDATYREAA